MAAVNYKENRITPAYNNLRQALQLSPDNRQIALSLLKVLTQLIKKDALNEEQVDTMYRAARALTNDTLPASQVQKRNQYFSLLQINQESLDTPADA
ncbi:hypothetical protein [Salinimonas profundi]|uniref:hypothetical protein n=1 Tax=Salinimonas profundi TaxID=2729140 RepID=UPI001CC2F942|nr:hypothetical protein [Salinimonas profundi]